MTADDWIAALPSTWNIRRLGTLGNFAKGSGGSKEDNRESGFAVVRYGELYTKFDRVIREPKSFIDRAAASRYTPLRTGSLVFAGSGEDPEEIGKAALSLLPAPAYVGGDSVIFTPRAGEIDADFLTYVLDSKPLKAHKAIRSTGFTVVHISAGKLKTLPIPLPLPEEQEAIVRFLDDETGQIDALVAKQDELLTYLAERKRSVLGHVLEDVDGETRRLRWLYRPSSEANKPDEEVLSVYREHGVIPKSSRTDNFNKTPENVDRYLLVRPDDLVVNKMKAWQGSLGISAHRGIVSGDYEVLRPMTPDLDPEYAHFRLRSPEMVLEYRLRSRGIRPSQWRLYWQDLADIEVMVPPLAEQRTAAARIKSETARIDALVAKAEEHIALAKERRSALITAAVTGQIDVRTSRKAS